MLFDLIAIWISIEVLWRWTENEKVMCKYQQLFGDKSEMANCDFKTFLCELTLKLIRKTLFQHWFFCHNFCAISIVCFVFSAGKWSGFARWLILIFGPLKGHPNHLRKGRKLIKARVAEAGCWTDTRPHNKIQLFFHPRWLPTNYGYSTDSLKTLRSERQKGLIPRWFRCRLFLGQQNTIACIDIDVRCGKCHYFRSLGSYVN